MDFPGHGHQELLRTGHGDFPCSRFKMDTLRDQLASRLPGSHRRVRHRERTIPPHRNAHRCTCRWRKTTPAYSPCIPNDKWAGGVRSLDDPNTETFLGSEAHNRKGAALLERRPSDVKIAI